MKIRPGKFARKFNMSNWEKMFGYAKYYVGCVDGRQRYIFPNGTIMEVEKQIVGYTVYNVANHILSVNLGTGLSKSVKEWLARAEEGWFEP